MISSCCGCCLISTKYIIFDCLVRAVLHQRYMLVRCCMEYNVWFVFFHHAVNTMCISYRTDQYSQIQFRMIPSEFLLNIISIIFINVKNDQMPDFMLCQLCTDLTSDGPATTGYQHGFSFDIAKDLIQIDFDRITSQKIFDLHISKF